MTATGQSTESGEHRREPRGNLAEVHQQIMRGLSRVVTEAGHQSVMYVHDWTHATEYGQDRVEDHAELLANAGRCLRLATNYLCQLRNELHLRQDSEDTAEVPF